MNGGPGGPGKMQHIARARTRMRARARGDSRFSFCNVFCFLLKNTRTTRTKE
jgi:hypothetical protein